MELTPPTKEQREMIFKEINLNSEQLKRDTSSLKDWLRSQPHLPHDLDDKVLASFIVGCKNSLERSKQILDAYLTNRTSCPEFYGSRDPCNPTFRRQNKLFQYIVLPGMTPEGYRVSIYRMKSADISVADFNLTTNAIKVLSSFDVRFHEDNYWAGDVIIIDCKHFTFRHLQSVTSLPLLKKYVHCGNESLPVRFKKIIFINLSSVIEPVLSLVKLILKQKFVQRMITTTEDYPFLYDHVPKEILPDEYGGKAGQIEYLNDCWQQKVESYREWFLQDTNRKVDESKRPEKSVYKSKQLFGIEGSFKTLTLD
uniref:CRAL-TRIO domain-containing protein n=1 Tax=Graphocephala atropunctata TaxID=36148 RepID=A0A1B6KNR0_9HEMI